MEVFLFFVPEGENVEEIWVILGITGWNTSGCIHRWAMGLLMCLFLKSPSHLVFLHTYTWSKSYIYSIYIYIYIYIYHIIYQNHIYTHTYIYIYTYIFSLIRFFVRFYFSLNRAMRCKRSRIRSQAGLSLLRLGKEKPARVMEKSGKNTHTCPPAFPSTHVTFDLTARCHNTFQHNLTHTHTLTGFSFLYCR